MGKTSMLSGVIIVFIAMMILSETLVACSSPQCPDCYEWDEELEMCVNTCLLGYYCCGGDECCSNFYACCGGECCRHYGWECCGDECCDPDDCCNDIECCDDGQNCCDNGCCDEECCGENNECCEADEICHRGKCVSGDCHFEDPCEITDKCDTCENGFCTGYQTKEWYFDCVGGNDCEDEENCLEYGQKEERIKKKITQCDHTRECSAGCEGHTQVPPRPTVWPCNIYTECRCQ